MTQYSCPKALRLTCDAKEKEIRRELKAREKEARGRGDWPTANILHGQWAESHRVTREGRA